jgi:dihydroorotate dehydrogenase electron transfer subunit
LSAVGQLPEHRVHAPLGRRRVPVTERGEYGPYVVLTVVDRNGPRPTAGQFYMIAAAERWGGGDGERPFLPRAFSVLRAPAGTAELQFLIEDVGPGTRRLSELEPGDELLVVGPLGVGFRRPEPDGSPLLVGGGVGTAPLVIWRDQLDDPAARVLLGFRDAPRAIAAEALVTGATVATDDGTHGHHGLVTDLLQAELDRDAGRAVYACGPPAMLEAVRALCAARGVPAQLAMESGMACGFGACFGCVVPTRTGYVRLCLDGPVLDAEDLDSALVPGAGH